MEPTEDQKQATIAVYRETVGAIFAYLSRRVAGDRALAEDLTQETFVRFVNAARAGQSPKPAMPWLQTVARHLLLDFFRRQKRRPESIDAALLDRFAAGETSTDNAPALIAWAMSLLKPRWAALIDAFHLDGKSIAQIASETGLSERAVEGQLRRARRAMRSRLEKCVTEQE